MPIGIDSYGKAIAAYSRAATRRAGTGPQRRPPPAAASPTWSGARSTRASRRARQPKRPRWPPSGQGADLSQVVTAVAEAETTLQTVIAVRERVIEAYKEILRMPI